MMNKPLVSPRTRSLLIALNEWSDEAREASAKKRREKARHGGGSFGGKLLRGGLIAGGTLAGGMLGIKGAAKFMTRGPVAKAGQDLTGKILGLGTGKTHLSAGISIKGRSLERVLKRMSRKKGIRGVVGRAAQKVDDALAVPAPHYGVGVGKNKVAHVTLGAKPETVTTKQFRKYSGTDEGPIKILGSSKVTKDQIKGRLAEADKTWGPGALLCEGKNCEMYAREIAEGKKGVSKFVRALKIGGAAGGTAGGTAGAMIMRPKKEQIRNMLQVINGGPGSGHHGHKGLPGHRGGSLPSGVSPSTVALARTVSSGISDSPQATARRIKNVVTKTFKMADLYDSYAQDLEAANRKRWLPLKTDDLAKLRDAHAKAAKLLYDSADQATLVKSYSKEEQKTRLKKADEHAEKASTYHRKLQGKSYRSSFTRELGRAFVQGALGGSLEEAAMRTGEQIGGAAGDIAMEGLRSGFKEAMAQPSRKIKETRDDTMSAADLKAAEALIRRRGKGPLTPKQREEFGAKKIVEVERRPSVREMLASISGSAKQASVSKAKKYAEKLKTGGRDLDRETFLRLQKEDRESLLGIRALIDKEMRGRGYRVTPTKGDRAARAARSRATSSGDAEFDLRLEELIKKAQAPTGNRLTVNFTTVTANLTSGVRRETLQGREYLVAPLTMIVPGVLAGSKGPLYYPEEEVKKNPTAWNGMPIVVNHPMVNGIPVEARSPGVLDKQQIGTVFNARYKGKLVAEGWFDVERTRKTNVGIYEQLINNKPIELSTGLYTDNEPYRGVWNGREYHYVARNYRPDHLAILVGSRGACSIKDGCGVLINACGGKKSKKNLKLIRNKLVHPRVKSITEFIDNSYWKAAKAAGDAIRIATGQAAKDIARLGGPRSAAVKGARKAVSGIVKFTRKRPKTALAAAGIGGYQLGKRKGKKQVNNARPEKYRRAKQVGGAVGGFGAGLAGTAAGAKAGGLIGTALAPVTGGASIPVGAAIGGIAGGAAGAWGGGRAAHKLGGKTAGQAADLGGLAGTIVSPGGVVRGAGRLIGRGGAKVAASQAAQVAAKRAGAKAARPAALQVARLKARLGAGAASTASKVRALGTKAGALKAAKGTGKFAGTVGLYEGTTQGLDAAERGLTKKRKPVRNSLTPGMGSGIKYGFRGASKKLGTARKRILLKKPTMNWTDEARRKSAETRKRKALLKSFEGAEQTHKPYTGIRTPGGAIAVGAAAGIGSRIGSEGVMRGLHKLSGKIGELTSRAKPPVESFDLPFEELVRKAKEATKAVPKAGIRSRVGSLLSRIARRAVFKR